MAIDLQLTESNLYVAFIRWEVKIMSILTVTYKRKDIFGNTVCAKDTKINFGKSDLVKAFLLFSKHQDARLQIDDMQIYWRNTKEYSERSTSVSTWSNNLLVGGQIPFSRIKKIFYAKMKKAS